MSPEIEGQINYSVIGTAQEEVDDMSIDLVRRDEKSQVVPTPAGVAEVNVLVVHVWIALSPHQTSVYQTCLSLVLETVENRFIIMRLNVDLLAVTRM